MARNKQQTPELRLSELDTNVYIQPKSVYLGAISLKEFCENNGPKIAGEHGISCGNAFERFWQNYDVESITVASQKTPAKTTFLKKSGLLSSEKGLFKLSPIGECIYNKTLPYDCYAFLLLSKQWIIVKDVKSDIDYKKNLLVYLLSLFNNEHQSYSEEDFKNKAKENALNLYKGEYKGLRHSSQDGERYILPLLYMSKLFVETEGKIQLNARYSALVELIISNEGKFRSPKISNESEESFLNSFMYGIYDILNEETAQSIVFQFYPELRNRQRGVNREQLGSGYNLLIYGAPGTGKSYTVDHDYIKRSKCFRVTFHPDTDYASFVGSYKPRTVDVKTADKKTVGEEKTEESVKVVYGFQKQVFLEAYLEAWKSLNERVFLVIEEINRGNCAQVFGDIFQLLDRRLDGFSKYTINADNDIARVLEKEIKCKYKESFLDAYPDKAEDWKYNLMALPSNLIIIATMNTSDQSLFPMDSAFKRRWDTVYFPIQYNDADQAELVVSTDLAYSWGSVLRVLNAYIRKGTGSANKMIGNRFIDFERTSYKIDIATFRDKVVFFLFNDVFKDNESFAKKFFGDLYSNPCYFFEDLYERDDWTVIINTFLKSIDTERILYNRVQPVEANDGDSISQ